MPVLVQELWPVLFSLAQRGLGDPQDAEDVAQEVFLRICSRIAEFDRSRDAVSWAFGIATFEILTQRRRRHRRKELLPGAELPDIVDDAGSIEDAALRAELRAALSDALGELSEADLTRLGLADAPRAGAATPAERKQRQRALARLRIVWRRLYGEP